ncbi:hypothetical protein BD410DRAFT_786705 [Rickenella mellea]|uniref:Uncharacterized protein n=1 Tax=Rickenella mellea TaxID=50990 RepID=A0A4Y7Q8L5_9AGAM|nr:hypothetical protein BD410DRAFT_786705 [Rickenella mellea]
MLLHYKLELEVAGMVDGLESAPFTIEERMNRLKTYQNNWQQLKWSKEGRVSFSEEFSGLTGQRIWAISGDLIAFGLTSRLPATTTLAVRSLNCLTENGTACDSKLDFGCYTRGIVIDSTQNLLVLISEHGSLNSFGDEYEVRIHDLFTGNVHPKATNGNPRHRPSSCSMARSRTQYSVLVWNNYVGVLCHEYHTDISMEPAEICIWDWYTGEVKMHLIDCIASFAFVSDRHALLGAPPMPDDRSPLLLVADFHEPNRCCVVSALLLPKLSQFTVIAMMRLHTNGSWISGSSDSSPPFRSSPENQVIVMALELEVSDPIAYGWQIALFVPWSLVQSFLNAEIQNRAVSFKECSKWAIPWDSWGPHGARMMKMNGGLTRCYRTYGSRCIFTTMRWTGYRASRHIVVYDFNQLLIKRALHGVSLQPMAHDLVEGNGPEIVTNPTTMETLRTDTMETAFDEIITTALPYTMVLGKELTSHVDVPVLTQDHIVVINARGFDVYYF